MTGNRKKAEGPRFLSGWKEIANYLGKGVRTVQRYERQLGLPVRRPAGKPRASVVATKAEIDAWVAASPIRTEFRLTRGMPDLPDAAMTALEKGMTEMGRLRTQMRALRAEMRTSVDVLRGSIQGLWTGLNHDRWSRKPIPAHLVDDVPRAQLAFDLSAVPVKKRRAV
jgi:hypothetical protein